MFKFFKKKTPFLVVYTGIECPQLIINKEYQVLEVKKGYYSIKTERGYLYCNRKDFKTVRK